MIKDMVNEQELENIFDEKLYVAKKTPLTDVTNHHTRKHETPASEPPTTNLGGKMEDRLGPYPKDEDAFTIRHEDPPLPREASLDGHYDDVELSDVQRTKQLLASSPKNRHVTFTMPETTEEKPAPSTTEELQQTTTACVHKEKLRTLEREFYSMLQSQKDTLKMKSKIYKFIYMEIHAIRQELTGRVEELERENSNLKKEVATLKGTLERLKDYVKDYNGKMAEKAREWKGRLEEAVRAYLARNFTRNSS